MKTSPTLPRIVSLPSLFESRAANRPLTTNEINPYIDAASATGVHVYADLRLDLSLAAAETDPKALRYLGILQDLAAIADACAQETGARLLEIQEGRIHFLIESDRFDAAAFKRLIALSAAMTRAVYAIIRPKVDDAWGGFSIAADHGLAVLLFSDCGGGSAISLGNAANRPAKRLGKTPGVASGHLAIRTELLRPLMADTGKDLWTEINLLEPTMAISPLVDSGLVTNMEGRARQLQLARKATGSIAGVGQAFYTSVKAGSALAPTRLQAFCLRADLDGFTKQVEVAFAEGPEAVAEIVRRFRKILEYPKLFAGSLGRQTLLLPWAGDCATLLVLPNQNERFSETRKFLPLVATSKWHAQLSSTEGMSANFSSSKWAIGIAAGDTTEGNDGWVLVAELVTSERTFRTAAGWSVRRSNDGGQADGVAGGDTVLPTVDYQHLDLTYQKGFEDLGSQFKRLSERERDKTEKQRTAQVAVNTPAITSSGLFVPPPKPYLG